MRQLTGIIAAAAGDLTLADRTWVLLTEAPEGGWGISGHASTNAELVSAARAPDRRTGEQLPRHITEISAPSHDGQPGDRRETERR